MPEPGDVVRVGRAANVRYHYRPILLRVLRVQREGSSPGLAWLDGYVLDEEGAAIERRSLIVRVAGLRLITRGRLKPSEPVEYTAVCKRSGNWWAITIPELHDLQTHARRWEDVEFMARQAICIARGVPPASFSLVVRAEQG